MSGMHETEHYSIWPLLLTIGIVIAPLGLLAWPDNWFLLVPGLAIILFALGGWINQDARGWGLERASNEEAVHRQDRFVLVVFLIISEVMIFLPLFFAFYWIRHNSTGAWPPVDVHLDITLVGINTAILISSGITAHLAHHAIEAGKLGRFRVLVVGTLVLGAVFLGIQIYEFTTAGFDPTSHAFGTVFFVLTSIHGLHVLAGLAVLATILFFSFKGKFTAGANPGIKGWVWYWHFVDVVWITLFLTLYLGVI